jgi:hypothetical protein
MLQWMAGLALAGRGFPAVSRRGSMATYRARKQEEQLHLEINAPVDGRVGSCWQGVPCSVLQMLYGLLQGRKARGTTLPGDKCSSGWRGWPRLAGGSLQCPAGVPWTPPEQESKKNNVPGGKCSSGWQGWPRLAGGSLQCPAGVPRAPPGQESKKNNSTWR